LATYRRMPQVDAIVRDAAERFKGLGATIETVLIPMHRLGSAIWLPIAAEGATMQVANRRRQKRKIQQPIDQDQGIGRSLKRRRHAINVFSLPKCYNEAGRRHRVIKSWQGHGAAAMT